MSAFKQLLVVFAIVFVPAALSAQERLQLTRFDQLEEIALRVLLEGRIEAKGVPTPADKAWFGAVRSLRPAPPEALEFPTLASSLEKEREFLARYLDGYGASLSDLIGRARDQAAERELLPAEFGKHADDKFLVTFLKKYAQRKPAKPKTKKSHSEDDLASWVEMQVVLPACFPRWREVHQKSGWKGTDYARLMDEREATAKTYLKRYNLGPKLVQTRLQGAALLWVELDPSVRKMADDYLTGLNAPVVVGPDGASMTWEGRTLHWLDPRQLLGELNHALEELTGEFFIVRYAVREGDKVTDIMRVTGARLLFGDFYFFEFRDELVVVRREGPATK